MLDILKFDVPTLAEIDRHEVISSLKEGATLVKGAEKKLWVERYNGSGEATLKGPISANLTEQAPVGSVITHTRTKDLMVVHSHQIVSDSPGKEPQVEIRAHEFPEIFAGKRLGQSNVPVFPEVGEFEEYNRNWSVGWDFAELDFNGDRTPNPSILPKNVIYDLLWWGCGWSYGPGSIDDPFNSYALWPARVEYSSDALLDHRYPIMTKWVSKREIGPKDTILSVVRSIMDEFDLGIATKRMHQLPLYPKSYNIVVVHGGTNLTGPDGVRLRIGTNTINKYSALRSNKNNKVGAYVKTTYYDFFMLSEQEALDRSTKLFDNQTINVDASGVDSDFEDFATAKTYRSYILSKAYAQGQMELLNANQGNFVVEVDIDRDNSGYTFRKDFNLGDVVTLERSPIFDEQPMRVVEFIESEEEGVFEAYPVLKPVRKYWEFNAHSRLQYQTLIGEY